MFTPILKPEIDDVLLLKAGQSIHISEGIFTGPHRFKVVKIKDDETFFVKSLDLPADSPYQYWELNIAILQYLTYSIKHIK